MLYIFIYNLLDASSVDLPIISRNIDCVSEPVLCFQDTDCDKICTNTSFYCNRGECKKKRKFGCNETNGLISLNADDTNCLSLFPQLWNINGTKVDGVCSPGKLNTNVFLHYPKASDCQCYKPHSLYTKRVEKLDIPICVREQNIDIYNEIRGLKKLM